MEWVDRNSGRIPIMFWSTDVEKIALNQSINLSRHSQTFHHVAIMPDCHPGYGMPIGGVIACEHAIIPYAVGVDIGCGIVAARTDIPADNLSNSDIRRIIDISGRRIPTGEGNSHRTAQSWDQFVRLPSWFDKRGKDLAEKSLGTLGGGNHFMEIQAGDDEWIWLMIHSGSRNPGYRIAGHHHEKALKFCINNRKELPSKDLSYLPVNSADGRDYIREMEFAMDFASENRRRLMISFRESFTEVKGNVSFSEEVNIHHNYAALEKHFGRKVWVHRKGATSARKGQKGIIPGSMGTFSYIVEGLGNPDSFNSCSHGAGRVMGRREASRKLSVSDCDRSMKGIIFEGWKRYRGYGRKKHGSPSLDLSEAPAAYKNIEDVMEAQRDLVTPVVRLKPLGVVKG